MKIARRFRFEACHRLPHHDGPCRRPHGHSYVMELVLQGSVRPPLPQDPQSGFVADFGRLRQIVEEGLIEPFLDHHDLNESLPQLPYHSSEYLAAFILAWAIRHLEGHADLPGIRLEAVRLWETDRAWAEVAREEALLLFPQP